VPSDDESTGGSGLGATLSRKLGPMPVWMWFGIGVAVLAWYLIRKKSSSTSTSSTTSATSGTDLTSAQAVANQFATAGLMPYQGGDVYINNTTGNEPPEITPPGPVPPPPGTVTSHPVSGSPGIQPPTVGKDVQVAEFWKNPKKQSWSAIAKQLGVFGGSGAALMEYNLIPNKHTAKTLQTLRNSPTNVGAGQLIAVPTSGFLINLPYVGTVKT
jgi:hypothetical protein